MADKEKKERRFSLKRLRRARQEIAAVLPNETVTDEYGTRLKWRPEIEAIYKKMPPDSARLQSDEPRWQILLAPKYIHNRLALARFLAVVKESEAGQAYLYYPIGSQEPVVWYIDNRYTLAEFQEKFGKP